MTVGPGTAGLVTAGPSARESEPARHTAIVTGANPGIGVAAAIALARRGCAVLCAFWRLRDPVDPGIPQACRDHRSGDAGPVVAEIEAAGGLAVAVESDLTDPRAPASLVDLAERRLGPVDILVNNATGWRADTFTPRPTDPAGALGSAFHRGLVAAAVQRRHYGAGAADRRVRAAARRQRRGLGPDHRAHLRRRAGLL